VKGHATSPQPRPVQLSNNPATLLLRIFPLRKTENQELKTFSTLRSHIQMPVTIEIPTAFRRFTDGAPKVDCSAATVADALNELTTRFPNLSRHVRDDQGQIRQFLNVYLNEEDIRFLGGESCALKEGDRVLLVPSIAGGS
jgi:molybdopterin converting factor small subunit